MAKCVGFLTRSETLLADALTALARHHSDDSEIRTGARALAGWSRAHLEALRPVAEKLGESAAPEPVGSVTAVAPEPHAGPDGLVRELQGLVLLAENVQACWLALSRSAAALGEPELERTCDVLGADTERQLAWLRARLRAADPRAAVPAPFADLDESTPLVVVQRPAPESLWLSLAAAALSVCVGALAWLALGGLRTGRDLATLAVGLALMALAGLVFRRVRLRSLAAALGREPRDGGDVAASAAVVREPRAGRLKAGPPVVA